MPRFRILKHTHPFLHWDLLLETEAERLPTWRLWQPPRLSATPAEGHSETEAVSFTELQQIAAEELAPHRREYLDYVGPVSGDRGEVRDYEQGLYIPLLRSPTSWEFRLEGTVLQGFASLQKIEPHDVRAEAEWPTELRNSWKKMPEGTAWALHLLIDVPSEGSVG